ncbi:MAG: DUF3343 domain-containing protein [Clostridia bacterium]|nr:DUF3343 domain-containing protein [Clostridia bacterium]MDD4048278.1 DUF3343 domain-containing protein [Clostridia bacterium]
MEYVALFFTQSGAIKYNRFLVKRGIQGELKPVPRKLSSSCGISVCFFYKGDVRMLVSEEVNKIYTVNKGIYSLQYKSED